METNAENVNEIENKKEIDAQLEEAAKKHYEAIKHQKEKDGNEDGNTARVQANEHTTPATEAQADNLIHPLFTS